MKEIPVEILLYTAGLFDNAAYSICWNGMEGSAYRNLNIAISLTCKTGKAHAQLVKCFTYLKLRKYKLSGSYLIVHGYNALRFNALINPYLIEKKEASDILEKFRLLQPEPTRKRGEGRDEVIYEKKIKLAHELRASNLKYNPKHWQGKKLNL